MTSDEKLERLKIQYDRVHSQLEHARRTLTLIRSQYQGMAVAQIADSNLKILGEPCFDHYKEHGQGD